MVKKKRLPIRKSVLAKIDKKRRIRMDVLNGITSRRDLAIRHDMAPNNVNKMVKEIYEELRSQYEEDGVYESVMLQEKFNIVFQRAVASFEESQKDSEKVRTTYEVIDCPSCRGKDDWCELCNGKGKITERLVMKEVKGQAGDPTFLKVQHDCLKEMGRLKGLYPIGKREGDGTSVVGVQINMQSGGVDLSEVSNDQLLEAMKVLKITEEEVIDVDSEESDDLVEVESVPSNSQEMDSETPEWDENE